MISAGIKPFYQNMAKQLVYMYQEMIREAGLNLTPEEEVSCICESTIRYMSSMDDKVKEETPWLSSTLTECLRYVASLIPDHLMALYPKDVVTAAYIKGATGAIPECYNALLDVLKAKEKDGTFSLTKLADKYPFMAEEERQKLLQEVGPKAKDYLKN